MSRTINQLDLGDSVWLKENNTDVEYVLIRKDVSGCVLLRFNTDAPKRMHSSNVSVYEGCEIDEYLSDESTGFLSRFDTNTLNALQSRSIATHTYGDTEPHSISRKCYLLSYGELFNDTPTTLDPETNIVTALMRRKSTLNSNTARIASNGETSVNWWLRSPYSATAFYYVYTSGNSGSYDATSSVAVRPALNVAPATLVSDAGADKIYLLPAAGYRTVEFSGLMLTSIKRPTKALVEFNTSNLYDVEVKVCNNYGDTQPVWVNATTQQEVSLTNSSKTTDTWQVGVKCFGKANGYGYFEEPRVLTLLDES